MSPSRFTVAEQIVNYMVTFHVSMEVAIAELHIHATLADKLQATAILIRLAA